MGIKQLYNDNLRKLPNEYRDVSVMDYCDTVSVMSERTGMMFGSNCIADT